MKFVDHNFKINLWICKTMSLISYQIFLTRHFIIVFHCLLLSLKHHQQPLKLWKWAVRVKSMSTLFLSWESLFLTCIRSLILDCWMLQDKDYEGKVILLIKYGACADQSRIFPQGRAYSRSLFSLILIFFFINLRPVSRSAHVV